MTQEQKHIIIARYQLEVATYNRYLHKSLNADNEEDTKTYDNSATMHWGIAKGIKTVATILNIDVEAKK